MSKKIIDLEPGDKIYYINNAESPPLQSWECQKAIKIGGSDLKIWESQFVNNFKKKSVRFFTKKKKELKKLNFEEILNSKKILDN